VLVAADDVGGAPMLWGCYPMVPWAGRVRDGRFRFAGGEHRLPLDAPPHAIHGTGYRRPWAVTGPGALGLDLDEDWPFGGRAEVMATLEDTALHLDLTVTAGATAMPAVIGWHPCLRRHLDRGAGAEAAVTATAMWERDRSGIPTGELVPVPPGPWDDAFAGVTEPLRVSWPGALDLTLTASSSASTWVVYDQDPRMVCLEPQTAPPDAFNREAPALAPGESRRLRLTLAWSS
jgi:aldose 1-epimerase